MTIPRDCLHLLDFTDKKTSEQTHRIGPALTKIIPHHVNKIGAHVFLVMVEPHTKYGVNMSSRDARALARYLTLAAGEADAAERRAQLKTERRHGSETSPA
jgi:hypothetical protein